MVTKLITLKPNLKKKENTFLNKKIKNNFLIFFFLFLKKNIFLELER